MADSFYSDVLSFLFHFFVNGVVAAVMLALATLLAKTFSSNKSDFIGVNTSVCSSPDCVRCSLDRHVERSKISDASRFSQKLMDFESLRGTREGLERLYKSVQYGKTHDRRNAQLSPQKPSVFFLPGLPCQRWYDSIYSDQLKHLVTPVNFDFIRTEFQNAILNFDEGWFTNSTSQGVWLVFPLYNQGKKVEENCSHCPKTTEIVESIPTFVRNCSFGNALFSVVHAETYITPHYGTTNCRIRCHLPLTIPEECSLCVGGEERKWKERELLLFDDSFLHETWHRGRHGDRAVLVLDLWHPDLTKIEKEALEFAFSPPWKEKK